MSKGMGSVVLASRQAGSSQKRSSSLLQRGCEGGNGRLGGPGAGDPLGRTLTWLFLWVSTMLSPCPHAGEEEGGSSSHAP